MTPEFLLTVIKRVQTATMRTSLIFALVLLVGCFSTVRWVDTSIPGSPPRTATLKTGTPQRPADTNPKQNSTLPAPTVAELIVCPARNISNFCVDQQPLPLQPLLPEPSWVGTTCPEYFRWIHEDLRPWKESGITQEMVERARRTANFRLVIVKGKAYVQQYKKSFQSRDVFTLWGILQLLRRYPGRVPDLDLMFDCVDWPVIRASYFRRAGLTPPPLFRYCGDDKTLDIVFPDWSFWGWPEINIKPWGNLLKELKEANQMRKWIEREPTAYWKGNPFVAETRKDLLKCNVSEGMDWGARIYIQDWKKEIQQRYRQSNLASQCNNRFKIYIEGSAWSVSEKYILACDSTTLLVKPRYYDFFTRSLVPVHHYWPVREDDKCRSIKFAVDWGNNHKQKAQAIGRAASSFIQDEVKMIYVYDYMFHLLVEYSKLFKYKPTIPTGAVLYCLESMACTATGLARKFMEESMVKRPSSTTSCTLPPPFEPSSLRKLLKRRENSIRVVEVWEEGTWRNQTKAT